MGLLRKGGIFRKYLIFFILTGFFPLILSETAMFSIYEHNISELALSNVEQMFGYISANAENVSSSYYDITNRLYTFDADSGYRLSKLLKRQQNGSLPDEENEEKQKIIRNIVTNTLDQSPYIKGAVFVEQNYQMTTATRISGILKPNYDCSYLPYITDLFEQKQDFTFFSTHNPHYYNDDTQVITFAKSLTVTDGSGDDASVLGVLFVDVYVNVIGNFFSNIDRNLMNVFYLVDKDGNCIYSIDEAWIGRKIYEYADHISNPYMKDAKGGGKYFYSRNIPVTNWTLICGVDENYFLSKIYTVRNITIAVSALGVLICIIFAFAGSNTFSRPINHIVSRMKQVREGNLSARVSLERQDELGQIGHSFNSMVETLQETIDKVYVSQLRQKEAELSALKSQIQPHFLYNTLEVIRMMAENNSDMETAEMIRSLAQQFRYLIDAGEDAVPVERELSVIKEYFQIIHIRYGGRLKLEIQVSEAIRQLVIPKLTLQPVVENAVSHGLKGREGVVRICGWKENGWIKLEISDNGKGMAPGRLDEIKRAVTAGETMVKPVQGSNGIGLRNVAERLKMFYGKDCEVSVSSVQGVGTSVLIQIPDREGQA